MASDQQFWTTYHGIVGTALRRIRESMGRPQKQVANEIGISQSALSKIEKGEISVNIGHLRELSGVYEYLPHRILETADQEVERLQNRGVKVYSEVRPSEPQTHSKGWQRLATAALLSVGAWLLFSEDEDNQ